MTAPLQTIALADIRIRPQVRKAFDEDSLRGLAESIAESGLQQPLLCGRDAEGVWLIDGERRLRACRLLGWEEVPVLVESSEVGIADALTRQLACNLQREELTVVERAEGIRALMAQTSMTADQVAAKLGLSPATVSRALAVLGLPEPIRAGVAEGRTPADSAYLLARVGDSGEQAALAAEITGGRLTRDALARKLNRVTRARKAGKAGVARVTAPLGRGRSVTIAGKGLTLDAVVEWLEPLLDRAKKAKAQGLTLQKFIQTLKDQARA